MVGWKEEIKEEEEEEEEEEEWEDKKCIMEVWK